MKTLLALLLFASPHLLADDQKLIDEVRSLERVEGAHVGEAGTQGRFFKIASALHVSVSDDAALKLLEDNDAEVACMGAVLLSHDVQSNRERILRLMGDTRPVSVMIGCFISADTVGEFAKKLLKDSNFRNHFLPDPTPPKETKAPD